MPVRTKQLALASITLVATYATIYTAPAGETVIVKEVAVYFGAAGTNRIQVAVLSGGVVVPIVDRTMPQTSMVRDAQWTVLKAGDQLQTWGAVANAGKVIVSGAELEGVAD